MSGNTVNNLLNDAEIKERQDILIYEREIRYIDHEEYNAEWRKLENIQAEKSAISEAE